MSTLKIIITLIFLVTIVHNLIAAAVIQPKIDEISFDSLPETGDLYEMESNPSPTTSDSEDISPEVVNGNADSLEAVDSNADSVEAVDGNADSSVSFTGTPGSVQNTIIGPKYTIQAH
ncbi:10024_t:CDS:1, partial [Scutellospora calospora]